MKNCEEYVVEKLEFFESEYDFQKNQIEELKGELDELKEAFEDLKTYFALEPYGENGTCITFSGVDGHYITDTWHSAEFAKLVLLLDLKKEEEEDVE